MKKNREFSPLLFFILVVGICFILLLVFVGVFFDSRSHKSASARVVPSGVLLETSFLPFDPDYRVSVPLYNKTETSFPSDILVYDDNYLTPVHSNFFGVNLYSNSERYVSFSYVFGSSGDYIGTLSVSSLLEDFEMFFELDSDTIDNIDYYFKWIDGSISSDFGSYSIYTDDFYISDYSPVLGVFTPYAQGHSVYYYYSYFNSAGSQLDIALICPVSSSVDIPFYSVNIDYPSFSEGYSEGYLDGYDFGYSEGYTYGVGQSLSDVTPFQVLVDGVDRLMSIPIFGEYVTVGTLLSIAFGILLFGVGIKFFLGG